MQEFFKSENNFEQCLKCRICENFCPVMPVNTAYPGPKQSGPDGERHRLKDAANFDAALKYCLNCKRCEVACPSGVKIGDIIQSARIKYGKKRPKLRDMMLASTDFMGSIATAFAPVVNFTLALKPVKYLMDAIIAIDKHRQFPTYACKTFEQWYHKTASWNQGKYKKHISYFHGCYANYNYPQLGKDFVDVMNAFGYGVHLLEGEKCCGVAKISNGMIKSATEDAIHNVNVFRQSVEKGLKIVTVSSSCTMTVMEEYPHLLGIDNSDVKDDIEIFEKFIWKALESGQIKAVFKKDYKAKIAYHGPCHMERLGWTPFTIHLLRMIPGVELSVLDSNCCGIAGTYGFKKENYAVSQEIGRPLFEQMARIDPDFIACECETCKWQIEMSTAYKVKNPVSIFAEALDLEATAKANV